MNLIDFLIAIGIGIAVGVIAASQAHDWAASAEQQETASHATSNTVCWPRPAHTLPGVARQ